MPSTEKMLFNLQKFKILELFTSQASLNRISPSYAFAWDSGVYPIGHHNCDWHEPFTESFKVGKEKMEELGDFLDKLDQQDQKITFYDLESHYDVRNGGQWDRMDLVFACRYMRLCDWFGEEFWQGMVGNSNCPTESKQITRDFAPKEVSFG